MVDRDQPPSREDETRRAVFGQVDLLTAELEIDSSIYDGFAAAIMVKGQPRTIALTREYGDAVQLMALIERGRSARPAASGGAAPFDRDALIALIMEETTDDIVADGWDRLGKPNVLVQGCRYIRRNAPPSPEGYANPEASAKQFAGFIADRVLKALAAREEAPAEAGTGAQIKDYVHCPSGLVSGSLRAQPPARSGKVTWHSSGEDEGPDVGLQLDLGNGRSLWLGEGQKPTGWQISIVQGDSIVPVADVIDHDQARDLFDLIASAVQPQAREDAQPVADEVLPVAWVIRTKDGHIRMWTMSEERARTAAEAWGMEAKQEGLSPITHPAPDALRGAVEALKHYRCSCEEAHCAMSADDDDTPVDEQMCGRRAIREALAALQAEQKGGAA